MRHIHERWDGRGYPDRLVGEEIPLTSRMVFACNAYDAMTTNRVYRPALDEHAVLRELRDCAGTQFDPQVVQHLLASLGDNDLQVSWPPRRPASARSPERSRQSRRSSARPVCSCCARRRPTSTPTSPASAAATAGRKRRARRRRGGPCPVRRRGRPAAVRELARGQPCHRAVLRRRRGDRPCADDTIVVFGAPGRALDGSCTELAARLAERAAALVRDVSPAKRLADKLEVMEAVRSVTTVSAEDVAATLTALANRAATALSCEFGAAMTFADDDHTGAVGWSDQGWAPAEQELLGDALQSLAAHRERFPVLCQDAAAAIDLPAGFRREDGVSALHARLVGEPAVGLLMVVHAEPGCAVSRRCVSASRAGSATAPTSSCAARSPRSASRQRTGASPRCCRSTR